MGIDLPNCAPDELGTESNINRAFLEHLSASTDPYDNSCFVSSLLESKYEKADTMAVAYSQKHLTTQQQHDLAKLRSHFPQLFSGKLGCYPYKKVHLEINEDSKPIYKCPYPIPWPTGSYSNKSWIA